VVRVCDHEDGEAYGGVTTGLDAGQPYTAAFSGLLAWDFDKKQFAASATGRACRRCAPGSPAGSTSTSSSRGGWT